MHNGTVILVHGLWMTGVELSLLQRRLRTSDFHVRRFRYGMLAAGLDENLERLAEFISCQDARKLHLVGHSLGGVLALHTLRKYPDLPVEKVICLGSPLLDSGAARQIMKFSWGSRLIGRTLVDAVVDQPIDRWDGQQLVGAIAGSRPISFSRFFASLSKPHDGAVTVAETCLPGLADHLVMPVSHTGLVFTKTVADQCDWFLRHGCFRR